MVDPTGPGAPVPESGPSSRRRRTARWVVRGAAIAGAAAIVLTAARFAVTAPPGSGAPLGAGAAVVRGATRLAPIERVVARRGGRLPLYVAPASGPVIDSARVGALAARLLSRAGRDEPVIALVPRDSVAGLSAVGRLVVTVGESGLLVFGAAGARQ